MPNVMAKCEKNQGLITLTHENGAKTVLTQNEANAIFYHVRDADIYEYLKTMLTALENEDGSYALFHNASVRLTDEQKESLLRNAVAGFIEHISSGDVWSDHAKLEFVDVYEEIIA